MYSSTPPYVASIFEKIVIICSFFSNSIYKGSFMKSLLVMININNQYMRICSLLSFSFSGVRASDFCFDDTQHFRC